MDLLDTRTNQVFASRGETKGYTVANQTPYWLYRLNITATAGARRRWRLYGGNSIVVG